jgi:murein DD-endopeptidase MepM/ murein hydrolase activator NlpD
VAHEQDGASFDPKTWGKAEGGQAAAAKPSVKADAPAAAAASASFDPKSWAQPEDAPAAAADTPAVPAPPAPPPASAAPVGRAPIFAAAASALLLAGGAGAAYLTRQPPVAAAPVVAEAPVAAVPTETPVNASRRTLVLAGADQIAQSLAGTGLTPEASQAAAKAALAALGDAPGEIRLVLDLVGPDGQRRMTRLEATRNDGAGVVLTARAEGGFASEVRQAQLETEVRVVRGEMDTTSFYSAAVTAGIADSLIDPFANAFSYDFNFATDVKPGDIFEAAFEQKMNAQGDAVGPPTLVYVSLTTQTKSKSLYRFLAPGDTEPGWFDGNGKSTVTALMRTPVNGARITSNFGPRFHPVLHFTRLHGGTDFAAPVGTAVYAAAAGVVTSASPSKCAGNMAIVQHENGMETRYFHLSRYGDGIVAGARVTQGFQLGDVGNTGTCTTGPHLHYEVHINGEKVDPMSIDTGTGRALDGGALAAFRKERDRIDRSRAAPAA